MVFQTGNVVKGHMTERTIIRFLLWVNQLMPVVGSLVLELPSTCAAHVVLFAMRYHVIIVRFLTFKCLATQVTSEWSLICVHKHMMTQCILWKKPFSTDVTQMWPHTDAMFDQIMLPTQIRLFELKITQLTNCVGHSWLTRAAFSITRQLINTDEFVFLAFMFYWNCTCFIVFRWRRCNKKIFLLSEL